MTEAKRPLKVFLCHAHADRDAVRALYSRLTKDGVDAWLDKEKLLPGQDWELEIRKAVREADVVVVCLSKQFNQAGFRQKEVRLALDTAMEKPEGEIFIIPARLEECDNLESLRKWHWVDLFEEDGYEMLMRALQTRASKIGVLARITSKPIENSEQEKRLKLLQRQAKSFEESGHLESALKVYFEIESINPFVEGLEQKILGLQEKIRINKITLNLLKSVESKKQFTASKSKLPKSGAARLAGVMSIIFLLLAIFMASRIPSLIEKINSTSTISNSITPIASPESMVSATALPTEITDAKGVTMRLVPAGEFTMGGDDSIGLARPIHQVYLNSFYIDTFEVTNALFKDCVDDGDCQPPDDDSSKTRSDYYGNDEYDDYPVINVSWYMAFDYCDWRGARLPTEAEWEKAARGVDGRTYPWGEGIDCGHANYDSTNCVGDTTRVGSYRSGKSPYGIYDLIGNVMEWVADWFSADYYEISPYSNPLGPETGEARVVRGGSFINKVTYAIRVYDRGLLRGPFVTDNTIGFRCARSVP